MKELSKEDQKAKQIDFAVSEILDRILPADGVDTRREGMRMFAFNQICILIDHYKNEGKIEGYSKAIEDVKSLLKPMEDPHGDLNYSMEFVFEEIEKLKK